MTAKYPGFLAWIAEMCPLINPHLHVLSHAGKPALEADPSKARPERYQSRNSSESILTQGPVSFVRQVLDRLPEEVAAFGKSIGFVINYSPDQAIRFDLNGQPTAILDKAVRPGTVVLLRLGGRPIPSEALGVVFSK
jgi:hypothetical protein